MNLAGVRLRYWAEGPGGRSPVHMLGEWEESELLVEPVEQFVVLADTQQQARAANPLHFASECGVSGILLTQLTFLLPEMSTCAMGLALSFLACIIASS